MTVTRIRSKPDSYYRKRSATRYVAAVLEGPDGQREQTRWYTLSRCAIGVACRQSYDLRGGWRVLYYLRATRRQRPITLADALKRGAPGWNEDPFTTHPNRRIAP